jgi:hypothetical protein
MVTKLPPVGLLNARELARVDAVLWLSAQEVCEYAKLKSERRKEQWLAGRIAAKYVFLRCEESKPNRLLKITEKMLGRFSAAEYRGAVVVSNPSLSGGPARIDGVNVAISHVYPWACASIGGGSLYAVDLETPSSRVPDFYPQNFTPRERSWTGNCARDLQLDQDWLYTLLWSAKECLLKTPAFSHLSLWNMPSIEVNILSGSERLKALHDASDFQTNFEFLEAEVTTAGRMGLAVSGTTNLVLTALTKINTETTTEAAI